MSTYPKKTPVLLTANNIASKLNRAPSSVLEKIKKLGIEPSSKTESGFLLYNEEVLPIIEDAMRRPNGSTQ